MAHFAHLSPSSPTFDSDFHDAFVDADFYTDEIPAEWVAFLSNDSLISIAVGAVSDHLIPEIFSVLAPEEIIEVFDSDYFACTELKYQLAAAVPEITDETIASSFLPWPRGSDMSLDKILSLLEKYFPSRREHILEYAKRELSYGYDADRFTLHLFDLFTMEDVTKYDFDEENLARLLSATTREDEFTQYLLERVKMTDVEVLTKQKLHYLATEAEFYEWRYAGHLWPKRGVPYSKYLEIVKMVLKASDFIGEDEPYDTPEQRRFMRMFNYVEDAVYTEKGFREAIQRGYGKTLEQVFADLEL